MSSPEQTEEYDADEVIFQLSQQVGMLTAQLGMHQSANRKLRAQLDALHRNDTGDVGD
jgi:hypothetical protein